MAISSPLYLTFSPRTVFVTAEFIRAVRGVTADAVYAAVDRGEFRWVFDVSHRRADIRDLRFWARELVAPEVTRALTLNQTVTAILGDGRPYWSSPEIQQLLLVSRPTFKRLRDMGDLPGTMADGKSHIDRSVLAGFLKSHWCQPPVAVKAAA